MKKIGFMENNVQYGDRPGRGHRGFNLLIAHGHLRSIDLNGYQKFAIAFVVLVADEGMLRGGLAVAHEPL